MGLNLSDIPPGTLGLFIKNEDGTFSPIAMTKEQSAALELFFGALSRDSSLKKISSIKVK